MGDIRLKSSTRHRPGASLEALDPSTFYHVHRKTRPAPKMDRDQWEKKAWYLGTNRNEEGKAKSSVPRYSNMHADSHETD
jgi:hypothetical protein